LIKKQKKETNIMTTSYTLSVNSIEENNIIEAVIGTLSATDPDLGDSITYTLVAGFGDNSSFTITGSQLKANAVFDYETKSSYSIKVAATDALGLSTEQTFTINIINKTETFEISQSNNIVAIDGKIVGIISADPRVNPILSNGVALPAGSVLKDSSGQRYYKNGPGTLDFIAVEPAPLATWGFSSGGDTAWEILKDF